MKVFLAWVKVDQNDSFCIFGDVFVCFLLSRLRLKASVQVVFQDYSSLLASLNKQLTSLFGTNIKSDIMSVPAE